MDGVEILTRQITVDRDRRVMNISKRLAGLN